MKRPIHDVQGKLCDCCEGLEELTPMTIANRPGLSALAYRVGTHATFLETMKARLTGLYLELPGDATGAEKRKIYPLHALTTRDADDPAIALLDAWATVADVLTFYQERVANEGFLRTATERRSVLELARLVGYKLRPGVAASVYLAFTMEDGYEGEVPAGTRAQSLPAPGELPQFFETSEPLQARSEWNELKARLTRPTRIEESTDTLYFEGDATNLQPTDPLLLFFGNGTEVQVLGTVKAVQPEPDENRTKVELEGGLGALLLANFVAYTERKLDQYIAASPSGPTAAEVKASLTKIKDALALGAVGVPAMLQADVLPVLRATHDRLGAGATRLKPWLAGMITDLEAGLNFALIASSPGGPRGVGPTIPLEAASAGDRDTDSMSQGTLLTGTPGSVLPALSEPGLIGRLKLPPSVQPPNALQLRRDAQDVYSAKADLAPKLLIKVAPGLEDTLYPALNSVTSLADSPLTSVEALRIRAALFAHNIPGTPEFELDNSGLVKISGYTEVTLSNSWRNLHVGQAPLPTIALDGEYEGITPGSWIAISRPVIDFSDTPGISVTDTTADRVTTFHRVTGTQTVTMTAFGVSARSTQVTIEPPWLSDLDASAIETAVNRAAFLKGTAVYAKSDSLTLTEEPISTPEKPEPIKEKRIELDGLYSGLEAGSWLILSGERTDVKDQFGQIIPGIQGAELVMLANVEQSFDADLPGDKAHTTIETAEPLEYSYKRDTVTIYGNVVKATHGETREEVLGSGDGSRSLQQFTLKRSPLTYLAAPTPAGAESTLKVHVNDVQWHEAHNLAELEPTDRRFITRRDDEDNTSLVSGNGERGARLPTGVENVTAVYRVGIGEPGNVNAERISLLVTRPLGVKRVINPIRASGGADADSRDAARHNAPLAVMALDRLVSVQDYADFTRTFAGIGKACALPLSDGRRELVHMTIAGANDIPIERHSDLYRNLRQALRYYGDPFQPLQVDVRELMLLIIEARVRLLPDYQWEAVAPRIRAALLNALSFERRELGQDVTLSEVISLIQGVAGVAYVDVDTLDSVDEGITPEELELIAQDLGLNQRIRVEMGRVQTSHTVRRSGETCRSVAARYGMEVADLKALNPNIECIVNNEYVHLEKDTELRIPRVIRPAQIAYLNPDVPETLILTELT